MNTFEEVLQSDYVTGSVEAKSISVVSDTMWMGKEWFKAYNVEFTGADLVKFAELVLQAEKDFNSK